MTSLRRRCSASPPRRRLRPCGAGWSRAPPSAGLSAAEGRTTTARLPATSVGCDAPRLCRLWEVHPSSYGPSLYGPPAGGCVSAERSNSRAASKRRSIAQSMVGLPCRAVGPIVADATHAPPPPSDEDEGLRWEALLAWLPLSKSSPPSHVASACSGSCHRFFFRCFATPHLWPGKQWWPRAPPGGSSGPSPSPMRLNRAKKCRIRLTGYPLGQY